MHVSIRNKTYRTIHLNSSPEQKLYQHAQRGIPAKLLLLQDLVVFEDLDEVCSQVEIRYSLLVVFEFIQVL